ARRPLRRLANGAACVLGLTLLPRAGLAQSSPQPGSSAPSTFPIVAASTALEFIDTSFENASPVWYEQATDGTILVHLLYDHERESPNRAAGHVHFLLHTKPGSKVTLEIRNLDNVWNGVRS